MHIEHEIVNNLTIFVNMFNIILWRVWSNVVVARQPKVKHFHGYAHQSVMSRCIVA
jgi:hypothetical protein